MAIVTQSGVLAILFFRFKGSSKSHCCNTDGLDILMKFFKEGNSFCSFVLLFLCTFVPLYFSSIYVFKVWKLRSEG